MKKVETRSFAPPVQPVPIHLGLTSQLVFVWVATLLVSSLPQIISQEFQILPSFPILWMRIVLLVAFIALGFVWKVAQPLRLYFLIFLALYLIDAVFNWLGTTTLWKGWFGGAAFSTDLLGSQLLRFGAALTMIVVLLLLRYRRSEFFLTKGELNATAEPVSWLGMNRPAGWGRFGLILTLCITLGTLAFLIIFSRSLVTSLTQFLPLIPIVLIASAMNAFSEEITYRAALLAPLHGVVGKSQALLLTAALFGLWHFYGVPYGVIGVIMAGVLGWLLGKSMLETKGLFWPWFIHFWQDVAIFAFIAAGSIVPGG
ncbi:MAG: CPBP family intramembrane metalloprotease [Anaerolineae bacterium]|nr:CPBP family intramembrane metalloprotease [Anaerolineae bacterium]